MTSSLRSWGLVPLLAASVLTTTVSCSKKNDDPVATATTGKVEGTISPAGAVSTVTATNAGGLTFLDAPNPTTGTFSLADLAPGVYTLSFTPATGYVTPATRSITVVGGQTATAGTVVAASDGSIRSGTVSWTTDGTAYSTTAVTGQVDADNHTFYFSCASTGTVRDQLDLALSRSFFGPGTYSLGGTYESGKLLRTTGGITTGTYYAGRSGTLVISSYSMANGTISGTFGFVGADATTYPLQTVAVTNGTFSLRF